jgi:hypothetical protein
MRSKAKDVLQKITNLVTRHFRPIWDASDRIAARELCNRIRESIGLPAYSDRKFDEGWQWRTIFHPDYSAAKDEFVNLIFGWW